MSWQPPPPPNRNQMPPGPKPQTAPTGQQSHYELLQVDPAAHPTVIRYAYRFLAGIYHPDNSETGNTETFRLITDAFKTLSDAGKRAAYDAQMGSALKRGGEGGAEAVAPARSSPLPTMERTSISYSEIELRLAILQLLLQARKKRVQTGGCSAKVLMDILGVDMAEMEFALWYLREKGYIERAEAYFMITVNGVDYIVDQLSKTQIIDEGPKTVPNYPGGGPPNLPASIR